jgi:hypothetical protein
VTEAAERANVEQAIMGNVAIGAEKRFAPHWSLRIISFSTLADDQRLTRKPRALYYT